jgi:hypothetical protein
MEDGSEVFGKDLVWVPQIFWLKFIVTKRVWYILWTGFGNYKSGWFFNTGFYIAIQKNCNHVSEFGYITLNGIHRRLLPPEAAVEIQDLAHKSGVDCFLFHYQS